MNSPELPPPHTYKDAPLVPAVDPEDLKRAWNVKLPWTQDSHKDACSPGADVAAVVRRRHMIDMLVGFTLLAPWTRDGNAETDAAVHLKKTSAQAEFGQATCLIPQDQGEGRGIGQRQIFLRCAEDLLYPRRNDVRT